MGYNLGRAGSRVKGFHELQIESNSKTGKKKHIKLAEEEEEDAHHFPFPPMQAPPLSPHQASPPQPIALPPQHFPLYDVINNVLLGQSKTLLESFASLGLEGWKMMNSYGKFLFLAGTIRVTVQVSEAYPHKLCDWVSDTSRTNWVIIYDFTAKMYSKRILAQNAHSLATFGPLTENFNGMLVRPVDTPILFIKSLKLSRNPGTFEMLPRLQMRCADGVLRTFDCKISFDPNSLLFVFQGALSE
jgi:hypothetical protein